MATTSVRAWTKLLGTSGWDVANALTTGLDGSIYVSGWTSGALDGQTNSGGFDAFLTKYSTDGTKAWTKLLGTIGDDNAYALTTGLDGSIYVSGWTSGALDGQTHNGGTDAFLTKYSTDGAKAWTKQLGTSGDERARALTTGLDGSIYVSGDTFGALDGQTHIGVNDAFLTKYSTDGTKAWTKQLGSSGYDFAEALTTGLDGSIYVGGWTTGALDGKTSIDGQAKNGNIEAFLIKYSTDGTKVWAKLLGSSGDVYAEALTTGLDGSIYVSGWTTAALDGQTYSGGSIDAFLTKYSADGTKAWTKLLGSSGDDWTRALTTGLDGSIYVSGSTTGALDGQTNSGLNDPFLTKFSTDGTKAWTMLLGQWTQHDTAHALTTGLDGSIYVSGTANGALDGQTNSGGDDAFLTKYQEVGTATYALSAGSTSYNEGSTATFTLTTTNVTSGTSVPYTLSGISAADISGGLLSGSVTVNSSGVATISVEIVADSLTEGAETLTVTAQSKTASVTINDTSTSSIIKAWTKLLGTSGEDAAHALTTGLDGSIYVSGYTEGALDGQTNSGGRDAFLTKYSSDGTKAWTKLLGTGGLERATALTTGLDGSIYVSGYTASALDGQTNSGGYDVFLTKYSTDGTKAWTKLLGTSGNERARALTTGLDGSIFVSGDTFGALDGQTYIGGNDAFLTKYSADGSKVWTNQLGSIGYEEASAITTGLDGSIYVSGRTTGALDGQTNSSGNDAFLAKYSANGSKAWTKLLGLTGQDYTTALATGLDGSIYLSGSAYGSIDGQTNSGQTDAFLTKYSTDGTRAWTKLLGSSGHDYATGLTTGLDRSIYVSGYTNGALDGQANSGDRDAFLTKYSTDGTKAWTKLLGTNGYDDANALTTGLDGSIYVSGSTEGTLDGQTNSGGADVFLIKYQGPAATPTYSLTASSTSVNEGSTATFTLSTTNVAAGTSISYTIAGGINIVDYTGGSTGTATVDTGGIATIYVEVLADYITEGPETLTVTVQSKSASMTINDISKTSVTVPVVTATAAADTITNLAVSQSIDGGAGTDTLVYTSNSTAVVISKSGGNTVLTNTATGEVDTLVNVERLKFADTGIALDTSGVGGQAYRVYKAAFNRTPDVGGLGFWISGMDGGASLNAVPQGFVNSAEFKSVYGASPTNAQIVTRFYDNVLGRAADSGGYNYWLGVLNSGNSNVAQVLASFSESAENQAGVIGLIGNGILYTPFTSPTYSLVASATSVNEGAAANFTLSTEVVRRI